MPKLNQFKAMKEKNIVIGEFRQYHPKIDSNYEPSKNK